MQFLLARQPIFDRELKVFAYELLYRDSALNRAVFFDGEKATSSVLVNTLLTSDSESLTGGCPAFVNFTDQLILDEIPHILNPEHFIIEVLEDARISPALVAALKNLKEKGFRIALDDFVDSDVYEELMIYVDIIKVDVLASSREEMVNIIKHYKRPGLKFLAEKVETIEDYQFALELGFHLFQGYFFSKPLIIEGKDVKGFNSSLMRVVDAMHKPEPDFKEVARVIEYDISLTYKLLRMVNSSAFYRRNKIQSVQQALSMIGIKELKKWIYLIILREHSLDKPSELLKTALLRAKFSEEIKKKISPKRNASDSFMTGMLSLIDCMMDRPLEELVRQLPLDEEIQTALLGGENQLRDILRITTCYEQGNWDDFFEIAVRLGLDPLDIPSLYFDALTWADEISESIT